jgi:hypothetical protein
VSWAGQSWAWQPFSANGIVDGDVSTEGSLSITVPADGDTLPLLWQSLRAGRLVELQQYEFDPQLGINGPPGAMILVGSHVGEVVGMQGARISITLDIGTALAPVGVQFPPRSMTSQLIGVPCQL